MVRRGSGTNMTHGVHSSEMPTRGCRKGAHFKTIAASFISTMKVDSPVMMLSLAPIRVKMRSVGESLPNKNTLSGTVRNQETLDERGQRAALHLTGSLTRGRSSRAAPEW